MLHDFIARYRLEFKGFGKIKYITSCKQNTQQKNLDVFFVMQKKIDSLNCGNAMLLLTENKWTYEQPI